MTNDVKTKMKQLADSVDNNEIDLQELYSEINEIIENVSATIKTSLIEVQQYILQCISGEVSYNGDAVYMTLNEARFDMMMDPLGLDDIVPSTRMVA